VWQHHCDKFDSLLVVVVTLIVNLCVNEMSLVRNLGGIMIIVISGDSRW
jgi:hypothetical protein